MHLFLFKWIFFEKVKPWKYNLQSDWYCLFAFFSNLPTYLFCTQCKATSQFVLSSKFRCFLTLFLQIKRLYFSVYPKAYLPSFLYTHTHTHTHIHTQTCVYNVHVHTYKSRKTILLINYNWCKSVNENLKICKSL